MRYFKFLLFSLIFSFPLSAQEKEIKTWLWQSPQGQFPIAYIEAGAGDKHILLIHGLGASHFSWRYLIPSLEMFGYHVWTIDLLGFGKSAKPVGVSYNYKLYVQLVEDFLQNHHITSAHFVGHSMGGGIALAVALEQPQLCRSLGLISAVSFPFDLPSSLKVIKFMGRSAKWFMNSYTTRVTLQQIYYDQTLVTPETITGYWSPMNHAGAKEAFIRLLYSYDLKELTRVSRQIPRLKMPVYVIWGKEDRWIPVSVAKQLCKVLPYCSSTIIDKCGHCPPEEHPLKVLEIITQNTF